LVVSKQWIRKDSFHISKKSCDVSFKGY